VWLSWEAPFFFLSVITGTAEKQDRRITHRIGRLEEAVLFKITLPIPRLSKAGRLREAQTGAVCSKTNSTD
jgi:hypothetical protein